MKSFEENIKLTLYFVGFLWIVYLIDLILPIKLIQFGIQPRNVNRLFGIICAPFIHSGWCHLIANTTALVPLLFIAFSFDSEKSALALVIIVVIAGTGTWLFGTGTSHFGASSVVFGLIGFLLFIGYYSRSFKAIVVSLFVLFFYGASLFALVMVVPGISWTGHAFGFIGGVVAAYFVSEKK